jgi:hypothetical protein
LFAAIEKAGVLMRICRRRRRRRRRRKLLGRCCGAVLKWNHNAADNLTVEGVCPTPHTFAAAASEKM